MRHEVGLIATEEALIVDDVLLADVNPMVLITNTGADHMVARAQCEHRISFRGITRGDELGMH
ncbi:hypothetical protein D3C85_1795890 [compost metagenome]